MRSKLFGMMVFAACAVAVSPAGAQSPQATQTKCPEGRTWDGTCVNAGLARSMRQAAIIFAQPKISEQAYPVLPIEDWLYHYPHQLIPNPAKPAPAFLKSP